MTRICGGKQLGSTVGAGEGARRAYACMLAVVVWEGIAEGAPDARRNCC